jgi:hypothetical protein
LKCRESCCRSSACGALPSRGDPAARRCEIARATCGLERCWPTFAWRRLPAPDGPS